MLIDNPEALRGWLAASLEPICDADPAALAKYVMALLKKDKPEIELKDFCIEQLDVFLQKETKKFVEMLFEVLSDKSYLGVPANKPAVVAASVPVSTAPVAVISDKSNLKENTSTVVIKSEEKEERRERRPRSPITAPSRDLPSENRGSRNGRRSRSRSPRKVRLNRSRSPKARGEQGINVRHGDRNTVASTVSTRQGQSGAVSNSSRENRDSKDLRDRLRDRGGHDRGSGESTPTKRREVRLREDRKTDKASSVKRGTTSDDKSADAAKTTTITTSSADHLKSKEEVSNNETTKTYTEKDVADVVQPGIVTATRSRSPKSRSRSRSNESDGDTRAPGTEDRRRDRYHHRPVDSRRSRRCRDFEERGYCMRGDLCKYDHGPDPVVVEDNTLATMIASGQPPTALLAIPPPNLSFPPPGYQSSRGPAPPGLEKSSEYNPETPNMTATSTVLSSATAVTTTTVPAMPPSIPAPMVLPPGMPPMVPGGPPIPFWAHPPPPFMPPPMLPATAMAGGRPLITVHQSDISGTKRQVEMIGGDGGEGVPFKRGRQFNKPPISERAKATANCTLEVHKIPVFLNNIAKLNRHFQQFGNIVNIQVQYGNDPEKALIQYSKHEEAMSGFRSSTAILNNRFIRIYWHNQDELDRDIKSIKDRLGARVDPNSITDDISMQSRDNGQVKSENAEVPEKEELKKTKSQTNLEIQEQNNALREMEREKTEKYAEKVKRQGEAVSKQMEVLKLLMGNFDDFREEQKKLVAKIEKTTDIDKKKQYMVLVKQFGDQLSNIKTQINKLQADVPKSKEQLDKAILDCELELLSAQQNGDDPSPFYAKLTKLRGAKAGMPRGRGRGRGRGGPMPPTMTSTPVQPDGSDGAIRSPVYRGGRGGRGRGRYQSRISFGQHSVDKRTKRMKVTGFKLVDQELLVEHLGKFGTIDKLEIDETNVIAFVTYQFRNYAEKAFNLGPNFANGELTFVWVQNEPILTDSTAAESTVDAGDSGATTDAVAGMVTPVGQIVKVGGVNVEMKSGTPISKVPPEELSAEALVATLGDDYDDEPSDVDDQAEDDESGDEKNERSSWKR